MLVAKPLGPHVIVQRQRHLRGQFVNSFCFFLIDHSTNIFRRAGLLDPENHDTRVEHSNDCGQTQKRSARENQAVPGIPSRGGLGTGFRRRGFELA